MTSLYEADIAISTLGDNTIVSDVAGRKIQVMGIWVEASGGANNLKFGNGTSGPSYFNSKAVVLNAQGSYTLGIQDQYPWFTTTAGNGFSINLSAGTDVTGRLYYKLA